MLEIKGLKVMRGDFTVSLPELYIADGQCVALCGVSGSGKSTLMEAIGLLSPYYSLEKFIINDIEVDELSPKDQDCLRISEIGIMPQVGGLLPFLTIRENIRLQIELAFKQKISPNYKYSPQGKLIPNTTVELQEAQERALNKHQSQIKQKQEQDKKRHQSLIKSFDNGLMPVKLANQVPLASDKDKKDETINPYEKMIKDMDVTGDGIDSHCIDGLTQSKKVKGYSKKNDSDSNCYAQAITIRNEASKERVNAQFNSLQEYIERLNLTKHLDKLPQELSIGQRQRALFLRAIAHSPRLLLIDEPTSALDPDNAKELFKLIEEIACMSRISILIITHDEQASKNYRRYVYDEVNSKAEHTIFVSTKDFVYQDCKHKIIDNDVALMSEQTVDYPAASGLSRTIQEQGTMVHQERNIVTKSADSVFHEIANVVDHNDKEVNQGSDLNGKVLQEYENNVYKHLGGYIKINDRVSHYTTPIDRLQSLLRKNNGISSHNMTDHKDHNDNQGLSVEHIKAKANIADEHNKEHRRDY